MKNNSLISDNIKKQLIEQQEKLSNLESQVDELAAEIETCKIIISSLEISLPQFNDSTNHSPANQFTLENPESNLLNGPPILSKEYTLRLLKESASALHANEIAKKYQNLGITTSSLSTDGKTVRYHLQELEKDGFVYQTNPSAQRSIRYAPVKKDEE